MFWRPPQDVSMVQFYVYVLKSKRDQKLYIGLTDDIQNRLLRHNQGRVTSTKSRAPFTLVHYEIFSDRQVARKREKYFKTGAGRKSLETILARVVELAALTYH